ncbi:methyl-accepting chemotaxis protein [Azospirillum sp. Sh1]|uniref:methyl-accepting chemotaxis protein n=1 Tax=Azospirillum sp. Sh1 TaxID=2607285 RepID=UPI001FFF41AC|nr:methyl-accepting chemotaxis protein [Azospirillum sp. Sh1]
MTGGQPGGWRFRRRLVRHIFDSSPDGYMLLHNNVIVDCNDAAVRMFGCGGREELVGHTTDDFDPERQPDGRMSADVGGEIVEAAERDGHHRFEWQHRRKDGTLFHVSVTLMVCTIGGYRVHLCFWQDIDALVAARDAEQRNQQAFAEVLRRLSDEFSTNVRLVEGHLTDAARKAAEDARRTCELVSDASDAARSGAAAVGTAHSAADGISAAAAEVSASITEISRQLSAGLVAAERSGSEADAAMAIMTRLDDATRRIEGIVALIHRIASQTNLLALNATIEAARAGEAGRGFSVVANEVKTLANQTAKATDDITAEVSRIQAVAQDALAATGTISETISQLGDVMTAIAAAIEEQRAATAEIARGIDHVADRTAAATGRLSQCVDSALSANHAAGELQREIGDVNAKADALGRHAERFMHSIGGAA